MKSISPDDITSCRKCGQLSSWNSDDQMCHSCEREEREEREEKARCEGKRHEAYLESLVKDRLQVDLKNAINSCDTQRVSKLFKDNPGLLSSVVNRFFNPVLLALCCGQNVIGMLELLLVNGADVNQYWITYDSEHDPDDEMTALLSAVGNGNTELTQFLLVHGADPNARNRWGDTALHKAVLKDRSDLAELLLVNKADANARNDDGETPLYMVKDSRELAELLLANGADVNPRDKNGKTPVSKAEFYHYSEVASLLIQHGAKKGKSYLDPVSEPLGTPMTLSKKRILEVLKSLRASLGRFFSRFRRTR